MAIALSSSHRNGSTARHGGTTHTWAGLILAVLFGTVLTAGLYLSLEPVFFTRMAPTQGPAAGPVNADPVARFRETRVGQVVYWAETSDNCRRLLFDNQTGVLYEGGEILCLSSSTGAEPVTARTKTVNGLDRMNALRKHFQK